MRAPIRYRYLADALLLRQRPKAPVPRDCPENEIGFGLRVCLSSLPRSPNREAAFATPRCRQWIESPGDRTFLGESAGGLYTEMYLACGCLESDWQKPSPRRRKSCRRAAASLAQAGPARPMRTTYATLPICDGGRSGHHAIMVLRMRFPQPRPEDLLV